MAGSTDKNRVEMIPQEKVVKNEVPEDVPEDVSKNASGDASEDMFEDSRIVEVKSKRWKLIAWGLAIITVLLAAGLSLLFSSDQGKAESKQAFLTSHR